MFRRVFRSFPAKEKRRITLDPLPRITNKNPNGSLRSRKNSGNYVDNSAQTLMSSEPVLKSLPLPQSVVGVKPASIEFSVAS
jgi:hypothetical protein